MSDRYEAITVCGSTWRTDCKRAKQFLGEQRIQYHWVDVEQDNQAMTYVEEVNQGLGGLSLVCARGLARL